MLVLARCRGSMSHHELSNALRLTAASGRRWFDRSARCPSAGVTPETRLNCHQAARRVIRHALARTRIPSGVPGRAGIRHIVGHPELLESPGYRAPDGREEQRRLVRSGCIAGVAEDRGRQPAGTVPPSRDPPPVGAPLDRLTHRLRYWGCAPRSGQCRSLGGRSSCRLRM
jgi:hypothetical protein